MSPRSLHSSSSSSSHLNNQRYRRNSRSSYDSIREWGSLFNPTYDTECHNYKEEKKELSKKKEKGTLVIVTCEG